MRIPQYTTKEGTIHSEICHMNGNDDAYESDDDENDTENPPISASGEPLERAHRSTYRGNHMFQEDPSVSDEEDLDNSILFSCRCESARVVTMLLSCLRHVSPASGTGSISSASMNTSFLPTSTTHMDRSSRGKSKLQHATVIVSPTAVTFYVYGPGRQSQATVDIRSSLFSEYYVADQRIPIVGGSDENDDDSGNDSMQEGHHHEQNAIKKTKVQVIHGGEFGVNLNTVLDCLNVLGTVNTEKIKLCLSYDRRLAILKVELLEEGSHTGGVIGGSILSTCAIPGMCVPDDDNDDDYNRHNHLDEEYSQHGRSALTMAFRSSPVVARAVIKSEFLRAAITELYDVPGATSASITICPSSGLEFATVGHTAECRITLPYDGNYPHFFTTLDCTPRKLHMRSYPFHSVLTAMKGLDIGKETCITMNENGMVAIQHQVIDIVGSSEVSYVDFIMSCLQEDLDMQNNTYDGNMIYQTVKAPVCDESVLIDPCSPPDTHFASRVSRVEKDDEAHSRNSSRECNHNKRNEEVGDDDNDEEESDSDEEESNTYERSKSASLFGVVAQVRDIASHYVAGQPRRVMRRINQLNYGQEGNELTNTASKCGLLDGDSQENTQGEMEVSFVDVVSRRSERKSIARFSSPKLMYGDTRLESDDDD